MLLCTGRQSGKTFLMARKCSDYLINHPKCRIIVVSLTEDQAQLMIIMILDYLERNHKNLIAGKGKKPTKRRVFLKNGAMVLARPVGNTGDAVRGFTGDVLIIDEASRMPELAFTAAKPTLLTTGGEIWMCSTPFGKQGYFYECFQNKHNRFTVIHTNSEDVMKNRPITEIWTKQRREGALAFLDEEKKDCSELEYAQEYLGKFIDDLRQLFSDNIIHKRLNLLRSNISTLPFGNYFLGVDIARLGMDRGTFQVIKATQDRQLYHVESIITSKKLTTETFDNIVNLEKQWHFKKIGIDAGSGSLGVGILDFLLRDPFTKRKVVALNNMSRALDHLGERKRTLFKEDLYFNLLALMEKGRISLLNDDEVRLSLKSVQYEYIMKEGQKTTIRIFSSPHYLSDLVEGLVRAAWLANQKHLNSFIDWI